MNQVKIFLVMICFCLSISFVNAKEDIYSIKIKEGMLREKATYLSKIAHRLPYGSIVIIKKEKSLWVSIESKDKSDISGWIHRSALTEPGIKLKDIAVAGDADIAATVSAKEIANAGKGWDKNKLNIKGDKKNIFIVNKMEAIAIDEEKKMTYLQKLDAEKKQREESQEAK